MVSVAQGTVVLFSDIGCPWAHVAVSRFLAARRRLGLEDEVSLDHRAFPLELFNQRPTPWRILVAEIPVVGALDPGAGWQVWQGEPFQWPVTTLLALEAVQAAKEQGSRASEQLDRALRVVFYAESGCISLRHVVLGTAERCPAVDVGALGDALDEGRGRRLVIDQWHQATEWQVQGSPHFFLADGTDVHNPGVESRWEGEKGSGFPVVTGWDPGAYDDLLLRAAGRASTAA